MRKLFIILSFVLVAQIGFSQTKQDSLKKKLLNYSWLICDWALKDDSVVQLLKYQRDRPCDSYRGFRFLEHGIFNLATIAECADPTYKGYWVLLSNNLLHVNWKDKDKNKSELFFEIIKLTDTELKLKFIY